MPPVAGPSVGASASTPFLASSRSRTYSPIDRSFEGVTPGSSELSPLKRLTGPDGAAGADAFSQYARAASVE